MLGPEVIHLKGFKQRNGVMRSEFQKDYFDSCVKNGLKGVRFVTRSLKPMLPFRRDADGLHQDRNNKYNEEEIESIYISRIESKGLDNYFSRRGEEGVQSDTRVSGFDCRVQCRLLAKTEYTSVMKTRVDPNQEAWVSASASALTQSLQVCTSL